METVLFKWTKPPLYKMVDNKQPMSAAPTVHWTLAFGIALCSVDFFGWVVPDERGFEIEFDDGE